MKARERMRRIYVWTAVLAPLACGEATEPPPVPAMPWFAVGQTVQVEVRITTGYDCAADPLLPPPDSAICGSQTDTVPQRADTLRLAGRLLAMRETLVGPSATTVFAGQYRTCKLPAGTCVTAAVRDSGEIAVLVGVRTNQPVTLRADFAVHQDSLHAWVVLYLTGTGDETGAGGDGIPGLPGFPGGPVLTAPRERPAISWRLTRD